MWQVDGVENEEDRIEEQGKRDMYKREKEEKGARRVGEVGSKILGEHRIGEKGERRSKSGVDGGGGGIRRRRESGSNKEWRKVIHRVGSR